MDATMRGLKRTRSLDLGSPRAKQRRDEASPDAPQPESDRNQLAEQFAQAQANIPTKCRANLECIKAQHDLKLYLDESKEKFIIRDHMILEPIGEKTSGLGPFKEKSFRLTFKDIGAGPGVWYKINALLATAMRDMIGLVKNEKASGQLVLKNERLYSTQSTRWNRIGDLSIFDLMEKLAAAKQSDDTIDLESSTLYLRSVVPTSYGGRLRTPSLSMRQGSMANAVRKKKSIIDPFTKLTHRSGEYKDTVYPGAKNLCLPLAVVIAKKLVDEPDTKTSKYIYSRAIISDAEKLVKDANLTPPQGPFTMDSLKTISEYLGDAYYFRVFTRGDGPPRFKIGNPEAMKIINLFVVEEHFHVIRNLSAFIGSPSNKSKKLCLKCFKNIDKLGYRNHKCARSQCVLCFQPGCANTVEKDVQNYKTFCKSCRKTWYSEKCFEHHKYLCERVLFCEMCHYILPRVTEKSSDKQKQKAWKDHESKCGYSYCASCKAMMPFDHKCFIQPAPPKSTTSKASLRTNRWYGDIESMVCAEKGLHRPNLLILERAARTDEERASTPHSAFDSHKYRSEDCIKNFVTDLIAPASPFADSYIIFHNFAGYDGHFIMHELIRQNIKFDHLFRGNQILSLTIQATNVCFRDSLLFIPGTPLSSLPGMYDLKGEEKGQFPHSLNTPEWLDKGVYKEEKDGVNHRFPRQEYFQPRKLKPAARKVFEKWYQEELSRFDQDPTLTYVIEDRLTAYCESDVRILRLGFEKYLEAIRERFPDIDPLVSITLPSLCNYIFRRHFMKEESIALTPPRGYRESQSKVALAWMAWEKRERGLPLIRHSRNGGEVLIQRRKVDGYAPPQGQGPATVFEFHGCHWHGCPCENPSPGDQVKYEQTLQRMKNLRDLGENPLSPYPPFKVVEKWGCQLKQDMKNNPALKEFIKSFKSSLNDDVLSPREAFSGGMTIPFQHKVDVEAKDHKVGYYDFVSLYPSVNTCFKDDEMYPEGFPDIYIGIEVKSAFPNLEADLLSRKAFGLIFCEVLAPRDLLHPILPVHVNDKLVFPSCYSCATTLNSESCSHSDSERCIEGHFTTLEISRALRDGYRLVRVHELWHYPRQSKELLRGFITSAYLDKEYASGFPEGVQTHHQKQDYASRVSKLLDQPVDVSKFSFNPGKRALAKVFLNNFWGYFGMKGDNPTTEIIDNFDDLVAIDADKDNKELLSVEMMGDDHILASWKPVKEKAGKKTSVVIAAFTTALARLRIHKLLTEFNDRAIYMDTDSLFCHIRSNEPPPVTGGTLGELKDEIESEFPTQGAYISNIIVLGGKSYAYVIKDRHGNVLKTIVKFKGLRLTCETADMINKDSLRELVEKPGSVKRAPQTRFDKSILKQQVATVHMYKQCRFTSDKRRLLPHTPYLSSVPYGWVDK